MEFRQGAGATYGVFGAKISTGICSEALISYELSGKIFLKGGFAYFTQQETIRKDDYSLFDKATLNYSFPGARVIISFDGTYYDYSKTRFYVYTGYQASGMLRNHIKETYKNPDKHIVIKNMVVMDDFMKEMNSKIINSIITGIDITRQLSPQLKLVAGPYFIYTFADSERHRYWGNLGIELGMNYLLPASE